MGTENKTSPPGLLKAKARRPFTIRLLVDPGFLPPCFQSPLERPQTRLQGRPPSPTGLHEMYRSQPWRRPARLLEGCGVTSPMRGPHLPGDDGDLGHSCLSKRVEKLGAMPDDAPVLLRGAWS